MKKSKISTQAIDRLADLRIRQNRDFFNIQPSLALEIVRDIATTLDDAEMKIYSLNFSSVNNDSDEPAEPKKKCQNCALAC